ncbi:solute carrier family 32 (vesicular inhibitory amino acid transporter) [Paragonimus westermani]|uniref:Solute carrier family 32 (Vesicular inhibitory amino acid transporter) n=1 Tax=Paragonimus westermani TaxID=34504 RepID=A0A5J4NAR8_9TREM|nr:solute carrier family 32 (vesicular inhibitory amino acid transporter) [Paragonimus westermani]
MNSGVLSSRTTFLLPGTCDTFDEGNAQGIDTKASKGPNITHSLASSSWKQYGSIANSTNNSGSRAHPDKSMDLFTSIDGINESDFEVHRCTVHEGVSLKQDRSIVRQTSHLLLNSLITSLQDAHGCVPKCRRQKQIDTKQSGPDAEGLNQTRSSEVDPEHSHKYDNATQRTTPTWVAGWNVLNLIQGIGILGIPYACANAGWICIPAMLLIALLCCHTGRLLGDCLYQYPDEHCTNYFTNPQQLLRRTRVRSTNACIAADVFPCGGSRIVGIIVIVELFGASVLYMILLGQSATALFNPILMLHWPASCWTAIMTYLCVPILLYPHMRVIAWFSVFSLSGLFASIILVIIYCLLELPTTGFAWTDLASPPIGRLPVSLSIIIFSYCAHAALPGIEGSMTYPEHYSSMLHVTFTIAGFTKLAFGLLTASVFGSSVEQAVTDSMTRRLQLVIPVHVAVLINVFFSMPLLFYIMGEQLDCVVTDFLSRDFFFQTGRFCSLQTAWFVSTRLVLINLGLICGTMVPHFALVMALVGAMTGSLLCFILPALFHLLLFKMHLNTFEKSSRVLVILFGVFVGVSGMILSALSISETLANSD